MRIDDAEASLRGHLSDRGISLEGDSAEAVLTAMMDWYARERAEDATAIDEDGDMLLFGWGAYDWGAGPAFEYGLTRQLTRADEEGDEGIVQLSVTYRHAVTPATAELGSGHRWCGRPADLADLRREIDAQAASSFVRSDTPLEVSLTCEVAG